MSSKRILVCDDEPHIVYIVSKKLANAGFEVIEALDGEEAMEAARAQKPDLLITDYQMPYLSGLELCAKLRTDAQTQSIPVIMLTARGFSLGEADLEGTNVRKVLPKPFSPREVLRSVQEVLEGVETAVKVST